MPFISTMVEHQKGQQELVKPKLSKIFPKHLQGNVLCSTAQMVLITLSWPSSSKDFHHAVHGVALTSSTGLILKSCRLLLNRYRVSKKPLKITWKDSSSKTVTSPSSIHATVSLQWIQVMRVDPNFLITWRLYSEQLQWWSPTIQWLLRSRFTPLGLLQPRTFHWKSQQPTSCAPSSYHHRITTITVWEL